MIDPIEVEVDPSDVSELLLDVRDALHANLSKIATMHSAGDPAWRVELVRTFGEYVQALGFDAEVAIPIFRLKHELATTLFKEQGLIARNGLGLNETLTLVAASAMCAILLKRGAYKTAKAAVDAVASVSGIDADKIDKHRKALGRSAQGGRPETERQSYSRMLTEFSQWSDADLLKQARLLHAFAI